jgi:hypothetical protein
VRFRRQAQKVLAWVLLSALLLSGLPEQVSLRVQVILARRLAVEESLAWLVLLAAQ